MPIAAAGDASGLTAERIALLRCPVCRGSLSVVAADAVHALHIRCASCHRGYPITDGLPILLAGQSFAEDK